MQTIAVDSPYCEAAFWMAFASQLLLCMTQAVLYRYADFVAMLGGTEIHLGWIGGVGMIGSMGMRWSLGQWLDGYGPRIVWTVSLVILAATCFVHWGLADYRGLPIYLARVAFCTAVAGASGAWTTAIVNRYSGPRMPEIISILSSAGFIGVMLGAHLGDSIFSDSQIGRQHADTMFLAAGLIALSTIPFACGATSGLRRFFPSEPMPSIRVLARYQPGWLLLVGVVAGAAFALPTIYLRPYAAELHISHIGVFFTVSSMIALVSRFILRGIDRWLGISRLILCGLATMVIAQLLFLVVRTPKELAMPAVAMGVSQAVLFPMVVAEGVAPFPPPCRGLGSALVLTTFDLGQVLGIPAAGVIIHISKSFGLPGYAAMFVSMALALLAVAVLYGASGAMREGRRRASDP